MIRITISLALALAVAAPAASHELGTTEVLLAATRGGMYVADISTDAASLLARLETAAGLPRSGLLETPEYARRISGLAAVLLDRIEVRFDGVRVSPSLEYLPESAAHSQEPGAAVAVLRLRGAVPQGARAMTWRSRLTAASYALILSTPAGAEPRTVSLEGDAVSAVLTLSAHGEGAGGRDAGRSAEPAGVGTRWQRYLLCVLGLLVLGIRVLSFVARGSSRRRTVRTEPSAGAGERPAWRAGRVPVGAYSSRSAEAIGSRAARTAGSSPPMKPMASA